MDAAQVRRTVQYTSMPEEFMRGGGCFAPEAEVLFTLTQTLTLTLTTTLTLTLTRRQRSSRS